MPALAVVEVQALMQVVLAALLAGVGVTVLFSLVIYCTTRAAELQRDGAVIVATILGALALLGLVACVAGVAFGIQVMTTK
jgi:hypothetical protein